ncbi:hypothetical protein PAMP_010971 [Pampus punctatissimus]
MLKEKNANQNQTMEAGSPARQRGRQIIFVDTDLLTATRRLANYSPIPTTAFCEASVCRKCSTFNL